MRRRAGIAILVLALCVLGGAVTPTAVNACGLDFPDPDERVAMFAEGAESVVVGEVVAEEADQSPSGGEAFKSTFRVVATLAGEPPTDLVLANLGYLGADCSGGPRLREGDRFLLFLTTQRAAPMGEGHLPTGEWRVDAVGMATFLLDEGEAWFTQRGEPDEDESAVSAEALLREVGAALDSDATEVERAITFANGGELPPQVAERPTNPFAMWGAVAIALIATGIIVSWYLRGRSRRRR